jgi:hypothetical protein
MARPCAFLGYRRQALSGCDPLLAPTVRITVYDAIGRGQHFSEVPSSVVHAAQRELELEVELLVRVSAMTATVPPLFGPDMLTNPNATYARIRGPSIGMSSLVFGS